MHLFNLKKSLVSLYICLVALLAVVTFVEHVRGTEFCRKVCLSYSLVLLFVGSTCCIGSCRVG